MHTWVFQKIHSSNPGVAKIKKLQEGVPIRRYVYMVARYVCVQIEKLVTLCSACKETWNAPPKTHGTNNSRVHMYFHKLISLRDHWSWDKWQYHYWNCRSWTSSCKLFSCWCDDFCPQWVQSMAKNCWVAHHRHSYMYLP